MDVSLVNRFHTQHQLSVRVVLGAYLKYARGPLECFVPSDGNLLRRGSDHVYLQQVVGTTLREDSVIAAFGRARE